MKVFVGITDVDWYNYLRDNNYTEANFWKPSGAPFRALKEGDLFLFKLKKKHGNRIAGGGFFTKWLTMSVDWAWRAFRNENGVVNLAHLSDKIDQYRVKNKMAVENPNIGCIILNDVFFFEDRDWFDAPGNWQGIVVGKTFSSEEEDGRWLLDQVAIRLSGLGLQSGSLVGAQGSLLGGGERYVRAFTKRRLGQGAFRALVADAYHNRCAITGERTMPVLQAAHIRPYSQDGPHEVTNGLFLRSDMHTLFDGGYLTVTPDYEVRVSHRVHDDFGNGRVYYAYQGERLLVMPDAMRDQPSRDFLEWHNDCVFLG